MTAFKFGRQFNGLQIKAGLDSCASLDHALPGKTACG
jgi:hypothetical protein